MLAGFNLLLWTTHLTDDLLPHCVAIRAAGYDGVEIPIFEGDVSHYRAMGARLDDIGLRRTAVGIAQSPEANPMSLNLAAREAGIDHLKWMVECCAEAGVELLCGPFHGPLGVFTGTGPTARELDVLADSHRKMARFAHGAWARPVAVNDLGYVSYRSPAYVLDLFGLGNTTAMQLRTGGAPDAWADGLVQEAGVQLIMIYADWVAPGVPAAWTPVGDLEILGPAGYLGGRRVSFYAARPDDVPEITAALETFLPDLHPDAQFTYATDILKGTSP